MDVALFSVIFAIIGTYLWWRINLIIAGLLDDHNERGYREYRIERLERELGIGDEYGEWRPSKFLRHEVVSDPAGYLHNANVYQSSDGREWYSLDED